MLADVWDEDVMDMAVDILVIDARDDVVTKSLASVAINALLVVVVLDVVMAVVAAASVAVNVLVGTRTGARIDVLFGIKSNVVVAMLIDALVSVAVAVGPGNMLGGLNVNIFIIPASPEEECLFFR